ncbi:glycoside hydrolase family 97 protein [Duncaniella freteri]|jgi:hypothetical protein|uniref:Glycoside hydrolase family 97 protein n=18 Tax=Duncaniella TaxID=2518495 RepID=A0A4Z0V7X8_9BACT|nr:glycoside hydrolase family 97 protein [Duncaniella freteri]
MNRIVTTALSAVMCVAASASPTDNLTVSSPDGLTVVTVSVVDGVPTYSVAHKGEKFIMDSPLGVNTNIGDFTGSMSLMEASADRKVSDSYSLPNIKKSHVEYRANSRDYTFGREGKKIYDVIFEVSDNNVAFRYKLYPQGERLCCLVLNETTGFVMPHGTTTFLCPQSKPMGGFARTSPSYETGYTMDDATGKNGWGEGYTFPCLFRNGDKGWTLISETGIAGDYCASRLLGGDGGRYTVGYPQSGEMNGFGSSCASIPLPGYTPWRTITVGETLAPVVETTVPFDVVRPLYAPSKDYTYGKGMWSWIIGMDSSCNFDEQKRYVDFASEMGYTSLLVDALWDTQIGYDRMEELAAYGHSKGVDLVLWYNSNGSWNDAPQGPRGIMNDIVKRRKDMAWMQKNGIRGIKVDFFGGDKQETMRLYHDILADANDYGLLVVFHGCTLPRGWERMYPNYAASEAVLASENLHFSQGACDNEAFNATIHPFVRNAVGSMDFGGSALNKHYNAANAPKGSKRVTSDVFALATAVMFQSALQHFALAPNNIADAPDWAIDFMKAVPTTWDDTRYIDGYPGRYAVIARRHGSDWYIVGVNASSSPVTLNMSPDMIAPGERVRLYSDDKNLVGSVSEVKADKKGRIKVTMPTGGGFVIMKRSNPDFHVYLCLGQSNMEGNARYESCDTAGISPRFHMMAAVDMPGKGRLKGRWYTAQPPLARGNTGLTPADYFGRELVKSLPEKVEVGVINVAVGGCRIELFDPINCADHIKGQPDWLKSTVRNYDNNPYQRLIDMARAAQADGVIKGILLHQGESNTGDAEWPVKVKNLYERILADLDLRAEDVPLLAGEMLSAEKGGKCASMSKIINTLPEVIPTAHVVSADGCDGAPDGLHFTAEGYRLLGKRYAQAMLPLLKK